MGEDVGGVELLDAERDINRGGVGGYAWSERPTVDCLGVPRRRCKFH